MFFVEPMISFHHTTHKPNEIPENFYSANTIEVLRLVILMYYCIIKPFGKSVYFFIRIYFIARNACEKIPPDLTSALYYYLEI